MNFEEVPVLGLALCCFLAVLCLLLLVLSLVMVPAVCVFMAEVLESMAANSVAVTKEPEILAADSVAVAVVPETAGAHDAVYARTPPKRPHARFPACCALSPSGPCNIRPC